MSKPSGKTAVVKVARGAALYPWHLERRQRRVRTDDAPATLPDGATASDILVIDDDSGDAELLRRTLEQIPDFSFAFRHATALPAARQIMARRRPDLLFLDYRLGSGNGLDAIRRFRSDGYLGPVIVVTGLGDEYVVADLMRSGVDDYVAKNDLNPELLCRAIRNAEGQAARRWMEAHNRQLLSELQAAKSSLENKNRRLKELYATAHQFVDNVSHEFRTPLTVIREFASILRDGLAGEMTAEQREYLDIVLNRTDDLATMVDDMLDISKLEAGAMGVVRRPCAVESVIERVRTTLERKAAAARVGLEIAIDPGLPAVYCDAEKIGRVIINLTVNALKFCRDDGRVLLTASGEPDHGGVRVSVRDNGPGIAPENLRMIFERFKQVEGYARGSTRGFGLGLSIVKELVRLNLGEVDVQSEPGAGSTFSFTIPPAEPARVLALHLARCRSPMLSLVRASCEPGLTEEALVEVDAFLQRLYRADNLILRGAANVWLLFAACDASELTQLLARADRMRTEANRGRASAPLPEIQMAIRETWDRSQEDQDAAILERLAAETPPAAGRHPRAEVRPPANDEGNLDTPTMF